MTTQRLGVGQVFVAGGLPTITYNPRDQFGLETQLQDYLDERHRILSISGPTKTGKTVLVKKVLKEVDAIWISGGFVRTRADFWATIADELGVATEIESSSESTDTDSRNTAGEVQVAIAKVSRSGEQTVSTATGDRSARARTIEVAARKALRGAKSPIVIDDFHYIPTDVQTELVRSLKDLVFDGVPVVVIAVPHRAYDIVRVEKEMTGRVQQLEVGFWSNAELRGIASKGFEALNLIDEAGDVTERLASESFASPHLMQDFCLNVVKDNDIRHRSEVPQTIQEPSWQSFFETRSSGASRTAFDVLLTGPRQRTDRKARNLNSGIVVDIYGAVLMAIGHTGPLISISYEMLRSAMRDVAGDDAPRGQELVRILDEMSKISRDQIDGEPVVEYDSKLRMLHISDPYFAFFLKWSAEKELASRSVSQQIEFKPLAELVYVEPQTPRIKMAPNPRDGGPRKFKKSGHRGSRRSRG